MSKNSSVVENETLKGNKEEYSKVLDSRKGHLHNAWWELNCSFEEGVWDTEDRKQLSEIMRQLEGLRKKQGDIQASL